MDNVTTLPGNVTLNLDEAVNENEKPPFIVKVQGREITFADPANLDWRDLLQLQDPTAFLRLSLSAEDRKFLFDTPMPSWRFNKLMEAYYGHFELEDQIREARRKAAMSGQV